MIVSDLLSEYRPLTLLQIAIYAVLTLWNTMTVIRYCFLLEIAQIQEAQRARVSLRDGKGLFQLIE
jgi:hypothetical protein